MPRDKIVIFLYDVAIKNYRVAFYAPIFDFCDLFFPEPFLNNETSNPIIKTSNIFSTSYVISSSEMISSHLLFGYFSPNHYVWLLLPIIVSMSFWVIHTMLSQSLSTSQSTPGDCDWLVIIAVDVLLLKMR